MIRGEWGGHEPYDRFGSWGKGSYTKDSIKDKDSKKSEQEDSNKEI